MDSNYNRNVMILLAFRIKKISAINFIMPLGRLKERVKIKDIQI